MLGTVHAVVPDGIARSQTLSCNSEAVRRPLNGAIFLNINFDRCIWSGWGSGTHTCIRSERGGSAPGYPSLVPSLFIARGKGVWWNAYSILVLCGKISTWPIRLQNDACVTGLIWKMLWCILKGLREWQSAILLSAGDRWSYPLFWSRLSVLEGWARQKI